eukprot:CAMPEP_0205854208 /NCGR_PEP_ID=MMETSP1083-20121108/1963_1 /ASSEMBLY_ACC=CAM_ASM_000430 /TAXON_ID=97485 /ORGANISM="Prymnesium parvum, Strain Texoma1" /LENGTH=104 /DNA_ID=CAMNT_0053215529 /DNA_START=67 /DNA_END=382 /DNA_ORIENTATION=+
MVKGKVLCMGNNASAPILKRRPCEVQHCLLELGKRRKHERMLAFHYAEAADAALLERRFAISSVVPVAMTSKKRVPTKSAGPVVLSHALQLRIRRTYSLEFSSA